MNKETLTKLSTIDSQIEDIETAIKGLKEGRPIGSITVQARILENLKEGSKKERMINLLNDFLVEYKKEWESL